ncbi:MAG: hypothetical protein D6802_00670 [Ardenticatenia bacterium]|nr:MAG: hypothetical protein D6802_00670 [Ardenticatenia bacterium]
MTCSFLDTLTDTVFERLVSGDIPENVRHHLETCESCRTRLAEIASLSSFAQRYLYRVVCPSPDDLALFADAPHHFSQEEQTRIQHHLDQCVECRTEYELLTEMLGLPLTLPSSIDLGTTIRTIIARLRPTSASSMSPTMALRGAALLPEGLVYETDDVLIVLDLEREHNAAFSLSGFISSKETDQLVFEGVNVHLRRNGEVLQTTTIDEFDTFVFSNVPSGMYHLEIELPDARILIETVEVA